MAQPTDRLLSQLNQSQLQQKDNPLYQVIKQLIDRIKQLENLTGTSSSNTVINETIQQFFMGSDDGGEGESLPIPGPVGATGAMGPTGQEGPPFPALIYLESDLPEDVLPIPGPQGPQGVAGNTGAQGEQSIGFIIHEEEDSDHPLIMIGSTVNSAWQLLYTQVAAGAANYDFINLGGYSEILVFFAAVTASALGLRTVRVSSDNGATFFTASGDYASVNTAAALTNQTAINAHATTATSARTCWVELLNFNIAAPKSAYSTDALQNYTIPAAAALVLNAIRVLNTAGNLNAGTIYVYGRV